MKEKQPMSARMATAATGQCGKCGQVKPASEFWVDKKRGTFAGYCKPCFRAYYREQRYPKLKATSKYQTQCDIRERRYRQRYPERSRARVTALRHKHEIRKDSCERCGSTERLHMHHPDYSQPLNVVTLCGPCHNATHLRTIKEYKMECTTKQESARETAERLVNVRLRQLLAREAEGYRQIAFPKGGSRTITTRDQQNHALVARGSYFACQRLLERFK